MAGIHSRYSPSSLYLTMACSGSLTLREKMPPQPDSPESLEGTVAHHVAMQLAIGLPMKEGDKYKDVEVTEEMITGAELWVKTVGTHGVFEIPVLCPDVHDDCWGTPDWWWYDAATNTLWVFDYKFGHRYVEEFENIQMSAYASGLVRMLKLPLTTVVKIGIVQPRCYMAAPVRTWITTAERVIQLAKQAGEAVTRALTTMFCRTGPHCIDCEARANCKTLQYAANRTLNFIQAAELHNEQTHESIGMELSLLDAASDLVEARRKALAINVESMIRGGQRVPGWEMKPGRSNLAWNDANSVIAKAKEIGVDLSKEAKPITPTQALDRKLVDQKFIDVLASRPPAGLKLAPVSTVATRKIFSGA